MTTLASLPGTTRGARDARLCFGITRTLLAGALWVPAMAMAACDVVTALVAFGSINPLSSSAVTSSSTLEIRCDQSPPVTVVVSIGPSADGSRNPRHLRRQPGNQPMAYGLFQDSGLSVPFGDGIDGTQTLSNRVNRNRPWIVTIYGRIPARQDVPAGSYSDSVQVMLIF